MFDSSSQLNEQINAIKAIPGRVLSAWPVWITFAVVNYVEGMIISAIPSVGGTLGTGVNAVIRGAVQSTQMAVWEAGTMSIPK